MVGFIDNWKRERLQEEMASLKKEIEDLKKLKNNKLDEDESSRVQKILVLHYLGVLKTIHNDTRKMSSLLGILFNRHQDNIRKVLEKVYTESSDKPIFKTESNLQKVVNILETTGYKDAAELASKDLNEAILNKP